jgi:hypothetical protein
MESRPQPLAPQGVIGVIMVLIGVVLVFDRMNLLPVRQIVQYWPFLLAGGGIWMLLDRYDNQGEQR